MAVLRRTRYRELRRVSG